MYICEICKKAVATIHLTDIQKNVKKELHICEGCAEGKGIVAKNALSMPQILAGKAKAVPAKKGRKKASSEPDLRCDVCGIQWKEFRRQGRFGCAHDYEAFRSQLDELLGEVHAQVSRHAGKTPATDLKNRVGRELQECERKLREAVEREAYEEAAGLRDRLAALRNQSESAN